MTDPVVPTADQRLRAAVESAPSGLLMIDSEGRIVLVNREVERLFGYPREELLGRSIEILVPDRSQGHHPGYRTSFFASPKVRAMGAGRELFGRRKDGSEVPVEIGLTPVATPEGLFVLSSIVDITARKKAEEQRHRLEEQLRQAQKMEALGTLAGGIAHDFNNLLGAIVGYTELLQAQVADVPTALGDTQEILAAARRGRQLIERILAFSRRQATTRKPLDLRETVQEVHRLLRSTLPATVEFRLELAEEPQRVSADATSIHQVVMNLATNAVHAMPAGGALEITLKPLYVRDSFARAHPDLHEGPYSELSISDTGTGIDPAYHARVFEPFFTTKAPGAGSGLGLAMVHAIIHEHEGAILLESELGKGTRIRCLIPALQSDEVPLAERHPDVPLGRGERILYVDDEVSLARLGERRLTGLGYQVAIETNPESALDLFRKSPNDFDLLVTDYTMPRLTGTALAEAVRRQRPDLKVIMLTGFIEDSAEEQVHFSGIARVLHKPVTATELAIAVREVLDG